MIDAQESASVDDYTVSIQTIEKVVEEWIFKYHPLTPEKAKQELISKLKEIV